MHLSVYRDITYSAYILLNFLKKLSFFMFRYFTKSAYWLTIIGIPTLLRTLFGTSPMLNSDHSRNQHKTDHLEVENRCISWEGGNEILNNAPIWGHHHHHHHHHLSQWIRSFELFRHRRVAIFSWGVHDLFSPEVCSWGRVSEFWCCPFFRDGWSSSVCNRWFKYDRDWFVCKQPALRSSCATLREWSHNLHPPSCSG